MAIHPLLFPLAANAAGAVVTQTAGVIGQVVSFADTLRRAAVQQIAAPLKSNTEPASDGLLSKVATVQEPPYGSTPLDGVRHAVESAQQQLLAIFRQYSLVANIEPATEFALQLDGNGNLKSLADDPDGFQIEQFIARDPRTMNLITELIDAKRVLQAAEENPSFLDAYQRDPLLAVAQFSHLFDGATEPVLLVRPDAGYVSVDF